MDIILLNAPPGSGKDTIYKLLQADTSLKWTLPPCQLAFAWHLKKVTHTLYGYYDRDWDYYEHCKDIPNEDFGGLTPRQAYIHTSEKIIKPNFGKKYFGDALLKARLSGEDAKYKTYFVTDSGFVDEVIPIGKHFGFHNLHQVKLVRPDYDFSKDSRSYWHHDLIESTVIYNDGDLDKLKNSILKVLVKRQDILL